ncbi:MAG: DUF3309 family protein [Reyranella sp.]|nr:DUF3309 family protein [Reyranella sp.]
MIVLVITVLSAAMGIAVMPCWRYSARWGYGPGACVGLLLVGIGISAVLGRVGASDALGERLAVPVKSFAMTQASAVDPARPKAIAPVE